MGVTELASWIIILAAGVVCITYVIMLLYTVITFTFELIIWVLDLLSEWFNRKWG